MGISKILRYEAACLQAQKSTRQDWLIQKHRTNTHVPKDQASHIKKGDCSRDSFFCAIMQLYASQRFLQEPRSASGGATQASRNLGPNPLVSLLFSYLVFWQILFFCSHHAYPTYLRYFVPSVGINTTVADILSDTPFKISLFVLLDKAKAVVKPDLETIDPPFLPLTKLAIH